jgi:hypothetical protein
MISIEPLGPAWRGSPRSQLHVARWGCIARSRATADMGGTRGVPVSETSSAANEMILAIVGPEPHLQLYCREVQGEMLLEWRSLSCLERLIPDGFWSTLCHPATHGDQHRYPIQADGGL